MDLNPHNPVGALFVGAWCLYGKVVCRVVNKEFGFGRRGAPHWVLRVGGIGDEFHAHGARLFPLPHTDPRVIAAVEHLRDEKPDCTGHHSCRCSACLFVARRDA